MALEHVASPPANDPRIARVLALFDQAAAPCACGSPACIPNGLQDFVVDVLAAVWWRDVPIDRLRELLRVALSIAPATELDDAVVEACEQVEARCDRLRANIAPVRTNQDGRKR